jgi:predicted RNA-binding protein
VALASLELGVSVDLWLATRPLGNDISTLGFLARRAGYTSAGEAGHPPPSANAMAYYIDLFSPETYEAFSRSPRDISGFRPRHKNTADKIKPGDIFVCYLTRLGRWFGLLEVIEGPFTDNRPIFAPEGENDPFVVRFRVKPVVWLSREMGISIHEEEIWSGLSFTRELHKDSLSWTGKVRGSLVRLDDQDGAFLAQKLRAQATNGRTYPLSEQDLRKLATHTVNRPGKVVTVSVPEDADAVTTADAEPEDVESRESIRIQAMIASIGAAMGLSIWIPRSDRGRVLHEWKNEGNKLLERLPLNYDDTTLRTIEQIDVLWLRSRSIIRAFEIEHTTSVYSGILRMADLLALQPNMDIKLHIVAPAARKEKVLHEIKRPVFSLLDSGPLSESCTYLSYDSIRELAAQKLLSHLSDSVLDQYADEEE